VLDEAGDGAEVVLLAMLEDQETAGLEHLLFEDEAGDGGQFGESVGWVGENEVELLLAGADEAEDVAADEDVVAVGRYLLHTLADERGVVAVCLHAYHRRATARQHLERYAARACKEVESVGSVKVDVSADDVEDVLLGEVGGGSCLEGSGNVEVATLVYSCYYSHIVLLFYIYYNV